MKKNVSVVCVLLMVFLVVGGCREVNRRVSDYKRYDMSWVEGERDLNNLSPTMFKMLGMLGEYISRFDPHHKKPRRELVVMFYPAEDPLVDVFEALVKQYRKEKGVLFKYQIEIGGQGHTIITSAELSRIINSFYVIVDKRTATLDYSIFENADEECRLSYIEGVYTRFRLKESEYRDHADNVIKMYNALYKAKTIARVLKTLDCRDVRVYYTQGGVPNTMDVIFVPGEKVRERLKINVLESTDYYKDKYSKDLDGNDKPMWYLCEGI